MRWEMPEMRSPEWMRKSRKRSSNGDGTHGARRSALNAPQAPPTRSAASASTRTTCPIPACSVASGEIRSHLRRPHRSQSLRWFWALHLPNKPRGLRTDKRAATLDEAKAEFEAKLEPVEGVGGSGRGPKSAAVGWLGWRAIPILILSPASAGLFVLQSRNQRNLQIETCCD